MDFLLGPCEVDGKVQHMLEIIYMALIPAIIYLFIYLFSVYYMSLNYVPLKGSLS